ncbi:predicted protein [Lichtheimia corymbifera JMRC:FSU:9682]|uniref:Uncharacterized protein n=1 Tax=Lichtheimia corymbifera JMRC:FSU:9682 TaxID=1263082 RepID=A0A068S1V3_9FUNG|nr:predicted protein [Lichtheimia corymbifera JMRC:FSU:9682]
MAVKLVKSMILEDGSNQHQAIQDNDEGCFMEGYIDPVKPNHCYHMHMLIIKNAISRFLGDELDIKVPDALYNAGKDTAIPHQELMMMMMTMMQIIASKYL